MAKDRKQHDKKKSRVFAYRLQSVFLGNDEDDDPVTSAVVEATEPVKKPTHLKGQASIAKQALFDALAADGQTKAGEGLSNDRKLVSVDKWREHCDLRGLSRGDSDSVARTAFLRAQKALQEKGVVQVSEGFAWVSNDTDPAPTLERVQGVRLSGIHGSDAAQNKADEKRQRQQH